MALSWLERDKYDGILSPNTGAIGDFNSIYIKYSMVQAYQKVELSILLTATSLSAWLVLYTTSGHFIRSSCTEPQPINVANSVFSLSLHFLPYEDIPRCPESEPLPDRYLGLSSFHESEKSMSIHGNLSWQGEPKIGRSPAKCH